MASLLSSVWPILSSYRPNAARDRQARPLRFGAFEALYIPPGYAVKRPSNDRDAQRLYNHIRTVAYWLDASPLLADLGLPFRAGLDDIISLVPIYGDILSGILQLYQVWLCFIFGVPNNVLGYMFMNVIIDVVVGFVPLIGDFIDNLFKSNLRNLALLEEWLLTSPIATEKYHILLMPEGGTDFIPRPKHSRFSTSWFGGGSGKTAEDEERERERTTGKVRATRRMERDEGDKVPAAAAAPGTSTGTRSRTRRGGDPVMDPLD
ncbi:hypothetical protein IAR55_004068 [Kwoniella newhampshirensis]|uniref:Derlin n=1 Tax=Kwoniella newhampshirensis TaxID=1651941 RepID=A0AAW0YLD0_9TREE